MLRFRHPFVGIIRCIGTSRSSSRRYHTFEPRFLRACGVRVNGRRARTKPALRLTYLKHLGPVRRPVASWSLHVRVVVALLR